VKDAHGMHRGSEKLLPPYTASVLDNPFFNTRHFTLSLISVTKVAIFPELVNLFIREQ